MPKVTYIEHDGTKHDVNLDEGDSLMEGALNNGVPGIDGDCGGVCACATCHVHIAAEWLEKIADQSATEEEMTMLELAEDVEANSRLGCQIRMSAALDGIVVNMPAGQI